MKAKTKVIIIIAATLTIVSLSLLGLFAYSVNNFLQGDKIASNVTFNDIYIGDITKEEAIERLKEKELPLSRPLKVTYNDKSFEFAPDAAGITYVYEAICDTAFAYGRQDNFFYSLRDIIKSRFVYEKIEPVYTFDSEVFSKTIETAAKANGIEFKNIDVNVYENYAKVKIADELKQIDFDKLYVDTMSTVGSEERNLTLPIRIIDKVTAQMIYDLIYVEPKNAKSEVKDGITIVTPHTIGVLVDMAEIEKKLSEGKNEFNVTVTKKYPEVRVENLSGDLFSDVLGSYTSKYNASIIGRTKNVTLSANRINGVILNSGDVFSYNNVVGPRTVATGFSVATVYTKEGLQEEMGGGICQTSSTLYNAVLYADLKIVERKNHMYTVSYVKNGLDATVAYGLIDFKFQNNLNAPIKIVTSVGGGVLTVTILGKKPNNNKVELYTNTLASYPFEEKEVENPELQPGEKKVTQNGSYGYKISATKVVKDSYGNIIRQESLSTDVYKPLTKIVEVGPAITPNEPAENTEEVNPPENAEGEVSLPSSDESEINEPSEETEATDTESESKEENKENSSNNPENGDEEIKSEITDNTNEIEEPVENTVTNN